MTTKELDRSNSLTDLAARINEAHHLAMHHAGEALVQAIACGQMLLEAKSKAGHGQWLPWLRQNVTFGERSAQGYMRIAERAPKLNEGSTIRDALKELATPRRHWREALEFRRQAWRLALLTKKGVVPKDAAVDRLWEIAVAHALVRSLGEDRIQLIISEAFLYSDFHPLHAEVA
jgi:hypothetical protein